MTLWEISWYREGTAVQVTPPLAGKGRNSVQVSHRPSCLNLAGWILVNNNLLKVSRSGIGMCCLLSLAMMKDTFASQRREGFADQILGHKEI